MGYETKLKPCSRWLRERYIFAASSQSRKSDDPIPWSIIIGASEFDAFAKVASILPCGHRSSIIRPLLRGAITPIGPSILPHFHRERAIGIFLGQFLGRRLDPVVAS